VGEPTSLSDSRRVIALLDCDHGNLRTLQSRPGVPVAARSKAWLPEDDLAHVIVAVVERVPLGAFPVNARPSGTPRYPPRRLLALLIYAHANGIFSSRRIERAT